MGKLLLIGIVGFSAQLIDGALGMAYGVSSTTLLLSIGSAPAVASATVHLAEVGTVAVSAASHTRFGNVEWRCVRLMSLPGFVGAFLGAVALSSLSAEKAEPFMAGFLFLLGVYVLVRFSFRRHVEDSWVGAKPLPWFALVPLGGFAGFMDAAGGGGWGPIGTPALLAGGVIAAPIAGWLVRKLPARILGSAVGSIILVTNAKTIVDAVGLAETAAVLAYAAIGLISAFLLARAVVTLRRDGQSAAATA